MKVLIFLCILGFVGLSLADTKVHTRGCIYALGRCIRECEEGTHAFTTGCGYLTPEATCEEPNPQEDRRGKICDYSACYCDAPTVRDVKNNICVTLDKCPKKLQ